MRKLLVGLLVVALLLGGFLIGLLRPLHCPVNRAVSERIVEGMTRAEVYAILGGEGGAYLTGPRGPTGVSLPREMFALAPGSPRLFEAWEGDTGTVVVEYYPGPPVMETVREATFHEGTPYEPGLFELVRYRLRRLVGTWLP